MKKREIPPRERRVVSKKKKAVILVLFAVGLIGIILFKLPSERTYTRELMLGMRRLSSRAQLLTPNLTEACFLTDTPYRDTAELSVDEAMDFADTLLQKLTKITSGRIVITGIRLSDGRHANVGRDADGREFCVCKPHEGKAYPGTGDLFASVLLGELLRGASFEDACHAAADFVAEVIRETATLPTPVRDGVALESHLHKLI